MKVKFHSLAMIIFTALAGFAQPALAMQNRDQTEPQQGLPPDKKRSLSKYGPEDVFSEQEMNDASQSRSRRKSQPARASTPSPAPIQSPISTPTPSLPPVAATPSSTINVAALDNQSRQQPLAQLTPPVRVVSKWTVPILSTLALVVFAALIFVLNKLRILLRTSV